MARTNEGYKIITAVPTDDTHEIVIGHALNPRRPAQFVCWDCRNKEDYSNGGYTMTYRQALAVMAERINQRYEYLAVEAPKRDPDEERAELLVPLFASQMKSTLDPTEPEESVIDAVQNVTHDLYCDMKLDHGMLVEWFTNHGWTEEDRNYFGISQMFDETEEE